MHPGEVLIGEEHVGVITDGSATIGGSEQSWPTLGLYRVNRGRVAACWLLPLQPETFDAIWSSGS
jgi:hypothetical protein